MTRVAAGAIPEFRAARRASVPLSKTFFRFRFIGELFRSNFPSAINQKLNAACRSMRRFEVDWEKGWPASPFERPKSDELRLPTGVARFTWLKIYRAETENVKL